MTAGAPKEVTGVYLVSKNGVGGPDTPLACTGSCINRCAIECYLGCGDSCNDTVYFH